MEMSKEAEDLRVEKFHSLLKQSRDMLQEAWSLLSTLDVTERNKAVKRIEKAIKQTVKTEKLVPGRRTANAADHPVPDENDDRSEPPA